jgi:hypothetical protein
MTLLFRSDCKQKCHCNGASARYFEIPSVTHLLVGFLRENLDGCHFPQIDVHRVLPLLLKKCAVAAGRPVAEKDRHAARVQTEGMKLGRLRLKASLHTRSPRIVPAPRAPAVEHGEATASRPKCGRFFDAHRREIPVDGRGWRRDKSYGDWQNADAVSFSRIVFHLRHGNTSQAGGAGLPPPAFHASRYRPTLSAHSAVSRL